MIRIFDLALEAVAWLQARGAQRLVSDSRQIAPGDAFVAWPGSGHDGRQFVAAALQAGAVACLVEAERVQDWGFDDPRLAALAQLKEAAGEVAHRFYGAPSAALRVVAITGTNGKTSSAWWCSQWLQALGEPTALIGTLGTGAAGSALHSTGFTTPDPMTLQTLLRRYAGQGLQTVVMEASSIGLDEGRLNATHLHTAVFTNLSQDHLDYHGTMQAYWAAKRALFDWPGLQAAVVNIDDAHGRELAADLALRPGLDLWTVSTEPEAQRLAACRTWGVESENRPQRVQFAPGSPPHSPAMGPEDGAKWAAADDLQPTIPKSDRLLARLRLLERRWSATGIDFVVQEVEQKGQPGQAGQGDERISLSLDVVGDYNLSNLLCALAVLRIGGHSLAAAAQASAALTPVPGRMQAAWTDGPASLPLLLVDYAHTPDAVEKALQALQPLAEHRGGRLWCVLGCGGERDRSKRPLMAAAAEREAARLVLTSDNPRGEDPLQILLEMQAGLSEPVRAIVEPERAEAIQEAVDMADARDIILLAGKGHEDYQEIAGVRHPFSDVVQGRLALQRRWQAEQGGEPMAEPEPPQENPA